MSEIDYTLEIRKLRDGLHVIVSSVPGLFLAGSDLHKLLADVPLAVATLRKFNGDERSQPTSSGSAE